MVQIKTLFNLPTTNAITESFYSSYKKGYNNRGIAVIIVAILCSLYYATTALLAPSDLSVHFFVDIVANNFDKLSWICSIGIGFEKANKMIDKIIWYPRVSSQSQEHGTSLEGQEEKFEPETEKLDAEHVATIGNESESAHTMLRKNTERIVDIVKDNDDTYCLMLEKVDRLSRADPLEACVFAWIMRENGVILYFDDSGYFDLQDSFQLTHLMFEFIQSRREYLKIINNTDEGQKKSKEKGGFPGRTPYGFKKSCDGEESSDNSNELEIHQPQAEVLQQAAELVINGGENVEAGNVQDMVTYLNEEYEESDIQIPAYATWLAILRRKKYTGKLIHDGEEVGECPQIWSEDTYQELQTVLGDRRSGSQDEGELDHALLKIVERFGVGASLEMFEDIIKGCCPRCGSDVKKRGSDRRWGELVNEYRCVNHPDYVENEDDENEDDENEDDENDAENNDDESKELCDFEGPLLSEERLREWEDSVPLTCCVCDHHLDEDGWKKCKTKLDAIEQTCDCCGTMITIDIPENKFERGFMHPELKVKFFDDSTKDTADSNEDSENEEDSKDRSLDSFD